MITILQAFNSRKTLFKPDSIIPDIHSIRNNYCISLKHIKLFHEICEIEQTKSLHILYPFTIIYPYLMRILCRKEMPFSKFKILNTRCKITMYRYISPGEKLNVECFFSKLRAVHKGIELDFIATLHSNSELVWQNTITYFTPSRTSNIDNLYKHHGLCPCR